jgi:hypothetical protein
MSPKRTPFQIEIDRWSHLLKVPRRWISHTHLVWLWGCSPCKILSPEPVFHGTKWLLWRPHIQSPTRHSRCRINKGLIKRGSTIDHWRSRSKGWILWPTPYTYIHCLCMITLTISFMVMHPVVYLMIWYIKGQSTQQWFWNKTKLTLLCQHSFSLAVGGYATCFNPSPGSSSGF